MEISRQWIRVAKNRILWSVCMAPITALITYIALGAFKIWGILDPFAAKLGGWLKTNISVDQAGWSAAAVVALCTYATALWFIWRTFSCPARSSSDGVILAPVADGFPSLDYGTYQKIRAYCWQDLAAYIDTPKSNATLKLSVWLAGGTIGEIEHEQKCATGLYQCRDLNPRENAAAHLLAVISNHRAITWQREPHPPAGNEPAPPLEGWQAAELARQTRDAAEKYAVYLPEREADALLACTSALKAAHAQVYNSPIKR